jgi:hypothetical protein
MGKDTPSFVKVYAAPGIDSHPSEHGPFNSGAGFDPFTPTLKTPPFDWFNEAPSMGKATERLVGNFPSTQAKGADSLKLRKRGHSPWSGYIGGGREALAMQHPGGIVDTNTGASSLIAGGPGAPSTLVRLHGGRSQRGMKLPVLPQEVKRGGATSFPVGGGSHEPLTAPFRPKVPGFASIFAFRNAKGASK